MAVLNFSVTQLAAACCDDEFRERLRQDPSALPRGSYASAGDDWLPGSIFHRMVDRFKRSLVGASNDSSSALTSAEALWRTLYLEHAKDQLDSLVARQLLLPASNLSEALQEFCQGLSERRAKVSSWSQVLVAAEHTLRDVPLALGGGLTMFVSGRVDSLIADPAVGFGLIDYKLTRSVNMDRDLLQLALYHRLLATSGDIDISFAALEYYHPERELVEVSRETLGRLFDASIAPKLCSLVVEGRESEGQLHGVDVQQVAGESRNGVSVGQVLQIDPLESMAKKIVTCFDAFKLATEINDWVEAPQLVRFKVIPGRGVKVSALSNRAADLQVRLGSPRLPHIHPGPGFVMIDVPKETPDVVFWKELLASTPTGAFCSQLSFPIGVGIGGEPLMADFGNANTAHALVAGASGSGKSEFLRALVGTLVSRNSPSELQLSIVDPKLLTFAAIGKSSYLTHKILTSINDALDVLVAACDEMDRRYQVLADEGFDRLLDRLAAGRRDIPFRVLIFDEFADLVLAGKEEKRQFDSLVARIAAKGRASGMHLVLATQRPDKNIVSGQIKANLPLKVCMRVTSSVNSQIVIGELGAEHLLGRGDLLCDRGKGVERAQSPFVRPGELEETLV